MKLVTKMLTILTVAVGLFGCSSFKEGGGLRDAGINIKNATQKKVRIIQASTEAEAIHISRCIDYCTNNEKQEK